MKWAAVIEYIADPSKVAEIRPHHRGYLTGLLEAGKLVCAGPFLDDFGALIVYEAESKELAIDRLRITLLDNLKDAETLPWQIPVSLPSLSENPWKNLFGLFKDDRYFDEVIAIIQAERDSLGDEELDPEFYQS